MLNNAKTKEDIHVGDTIRFLYDPESQRVWNVERIRAPQHKRHKKAVELQDFQKAMSERHAISPRNEPVEYIDLIQYAQHNIK